MAEETKNALNKEELKDAYVLQTNFFYYLFVVFVLGELT